ncbi:MAG: TIGR03084 family protein [Actinobacteria bacterium]|nr:TIGR03084 family protein [Actinomycetota bacterium]
MEAICNDLAAEHLALDGFVAKLDEAGWSAPTPASGWSVRDQISHLWFFDQRATMALQDPDAFQADMVDLIAGGGTALSVAPGRALTGRQLLSAWRNDREALVAASRTIDASARIPWYGPAMGARSFITARLMETWAHGQDVVDALEATREPTARLRHVAHIGVRARAFSYLINGKTPPADPVRVALTAPDGSLWEWDTSAADSVQGSALDFCLVVTQRKHIDDTDLSVHGSLAVEWMKIAQAFAGEPGGGRVATGR